MTENVEHLSGLTAGERALVDAALALTSTLDVEEICNAVLDVVERIFDARAAWILLYDGGSDHLVTAAVRGLGSEAYEGADVPARDGIVGLAFATGETVFVPDVRHEDRWYDPARLHDSGLPSVLTVPLLHQKERIGVLGFHSPRFGAETLPSDADRALLHGLGAMASLGIRNARLFQQVQDERTRRVRLHRQHRQLHQHLGQLREEIRHAGAHGTVIGQSAPIREVLEQAQMVAPGDTTVLLLGETGTGKELVARAIHDASRRARHAFLPVNCAAIAPTLLESELFGHEKGAFTGATERHAGKFELADAGTLFLDEIGELPPDAQAKLLRVLQDGEVHRVGGTKPVRVNVRVIAATNQDLAARTEAGMFRADLFYRLSVFPIQLPPLRDRPDDIPELVAHFVEHFAQRQHTPPPRIHAEASQRLLQYDWPGNVRELQNVIERAVILARGGEIHKELFPLTAPRTATATPPPAQSAPAPPPPAPNVSLADAERQAIRRALEGTGWRISGRSGAAQLLGLKPTTLHAKMKKLGIRRPRS